MGREGNGEGGEWGGREIDGGGRGQVRKREGFRGVRGGEERGKGECR